MDETRVQFLRKSLETAPDNTFIRYGLALELSQYGDPAEAWEHFEYLLTRHPEYAATYYQAGTFLARQGRREDARGVLTRGVEVTGRQGNLHAQSELEAALEQLKAAGDVDS